ncbi:hypothetical protein VVYB158_06615 [Vibrio vulnificus CladeA-yb158]|nr:hypothetical protein VVYB158_06615 [Vibrio vulnificus CladeA-yb158]HAS8448209.1 hypothetical protein [Vibrio vulnificus]
MRHSPLNAALGLSEVKMDKILKYAVKEAEDKYGKSVSNLKLLPVQFHTNGPYVSYPTNHDLLVTISDSCRIQRNRAYYQLAHEAVHTLSPVNIENVSWLEEGVAVNFSHCFMARHCGVSWDRTGSEKYDLAWRYVKELIKVYPGAIRLIFKTFGRLSSLEHRKVQNLFPRASNKLVIQLCARF